MSGLTEFFERRLLGALVVQRSKNVLTESYASKRERRASQVANEMSVLTEI